VFFSPQTVEHKKLTPITESDIQNGFATKNLKVFSDKNALQDYLLAQKWDRKALLMMSSGKFDGINLPELAKKIVG
jgi:UDP-N-acetylmuramate: L-alanyl-gamma-D-glutamyl-meso-diaminopimelate ligase